MWWTYLTSVVSESKNLWTLATLAVTNFVTNSQKMPGLNNFLSSGAPKNLCRRGLYFVPNLLHKKSFCCSVGLVSSLLNKRYIWKTMVFYLKWLHLRWSCFLWLSSAIALKVPSVQVLSQKPRRTAGSDYFTADAYNQLYIIHVRSCT